MLSHGSYSSRFSKIANVNQVWRFWSKGDLAVHYTLSEFSDMSELQRAASSEGFKYVVADYDRAWGSRVTRTRDILEKVNISADENLPQRRMSAFGTKRTFAAVQCNVRFRG